MEETRSNGQETPSESQLSPEVEALLTEMSPKGAAARAAALYATEQVLKEKTGWASEEERIQAIAEFEAIRDEMIGADIPLLLIAVLEGLL